MRARQGGRPNLARSCFLRNEANFFVKYQTTLGWDPSGCSKDDHLIGEASGLCEQAQRRGCVTARSIYKIESSGSNYSLPGRGWKNAENNSEALDKCRARYAARHRERVRVVATFVNWRSFLRNGQAMMWDWPSNQAVRESRCTSCRLWAPPVPAVKPR